MEHLIGNGTHLYRRSVNNTYHLVRTPIVISLNPVDRAYYSIAGHYDSTGFPIAGFYEQTNYNNVIKVGADATYAFAHPPSNLQYWRKVYNAHDPESVWYQGAIHTSAPNKAQCEAGCEAYNQFCGYRFQIPSGLSQLAVTNVKVKYINGGTVKCLGPAMIRSQRNTSLGIEWIMPFYTTEYLPTAAFPLATPQEIRATKPWDVQLLNTDTGDMRGARLLWDNIGQTYYDGGIPTLASPVQRQYNMGANTLAFVNQNRDFWITPIHSIDFTSPTLGGYIPYFVDGPSLWGCASVWSISIEVSLGGYD